MRRLKHNFKKGIALVLSFAMVAGLVPAMSGGANTVQAATGTGTEPSVSAYATKTQLMDGTFAPNEEGTAANIGKLVFGKNSSRVAQEWYILGKDEGVSGDNTIIFAASPIAEDQVFENDGQKNKTDTNLWSDCVYNGSSISEVYPNHYGASDLRVALKGMADGSNETYFTTAEQRLMNATTVTTYDTRNSVNYTTTDKLYALAADGYGSSYTTIKAGSDNKTVLAMSSYWRSGSLFRLRSPDAHFSLFALIANPGVLVTTYNVTYGYVSVMPASNLNLSSVLFASAATAASSDTKSGMIADGTAMTLRLDGTGKNIGTATYNITTSNIKATKGSTTSNVALVVQGKDGTNDWYYSKQITGTETVTTNASDIKTALSLSSDIDLSACKIWLEITEDNVSYAVNAEKEIEKINTTYVTKEQLMNSFKPYSNGTAVNYGKLVFGQNSSRNPQEWYILGKDEGVSGDNTIIVAASPIARGQKFNSDISNKNDENLWSDCVYSEATITEVYANHYGASELRDTLQGMTTNTSYFTSAEQGLMNATTVTTKDTKNSSVTYTTTDKLYALQGDFDNNQYLWAGTDDSTVLAMRSYWRNGEWFWLRSPYGGSGDIALCADRGYYVILGRVDIDSGSPVQPASNLDLSSVLFASAATAASSDTKSEKITDSAAMTLRLDGTGKDIGTVTYNTTTGDIKVVKGTTSQTVALVVQGNDGTNDWYYSKQITGTETINASDIKSALSLTSDIDLSACKIWLETTDSTSNLTYAVNATDIISITSVAITDIDIPVSNTALDTEASCTTEGVKSTTPQITWTPSDTTAGYNTRYTASITLTAATGYEFADNVTATVSGNTATSVTKNAADDTLTVTKEFTTDKRKIESVAAPTVPENNTFTAYYGYDGYDTTPISGTNTELGKTATVTFEGTTSPTTEDMAVTWTIESDGGVYDKTPEAENIFRWTIPESALTNYNAANCQGYDTSTGNITGTITVKNKAATPVAITGTDSSITYTGETVDVSQYFSIDNNAGAATYTLVTGTNGGTGKGTLSGTTLTVTQTGTFKIKVSTVANGIFAAGEKTVTLTVDNGTILYTATDYSTTYDGQPHSISVSVTNPEGAAVTYSTDGITYGSDNPSFSNEGTYTVYYRITKDNYTTVEGSKTVTINKKPVTITAQEQDIVWGKDINQSLYTVSEDGLITGDSIKEITLTPSTTDRTENGTISVSGVKIESAAGVDVTANYDITMANGNLKITHNTALAPERIEASKTKTTYTAGDTLNVDDLAVTVYYADGYSEPVQDYTTNVFAIDMSADGDKILTVSYTKNGVTKTKDITIKVNAAPTSYKIISGADSEWKQNTDETITIIGNGEFSKFESVKVDGGIIDAKNYTAKEGSTIIILKADYLKTLSVGTHSFEIVWVDGSAVTSFKVSKNTSDNEGSKDNSNDNPNSNPVDVPDDKKTNGSDSENNADDSLQITAPQTGDNSHPMLWVTLLAASLASLPALLSVRRKKDDE